MRLSDCLSKPISAKFEQSEGFLDNKKLACGKQKKIAVGVITLSYFCKCCDSEITFSSGEELFCIGINDHLISIDCVLRCPRCGATVPVWFLVESENEIYSAYPNVRILKRTEKLSENVFLSRAKYGDYSVLLYQAEQAYRNGLGAGAIIYLRKIFERITEQIAEAEGIETKKKNGQTKLNLEFEDSDQHLSFFQGALNRTILTLLSISLFLGSSILCLSDLSPKLFQMPWISFVGFFISALLMLWLLLTIFFRRKK